MSLPTESGHPRGGRASSPPLCSQHTKWLSWSQDFVALFPVSSAQFRVAPRYTLPGYAVAGNLVVEGPRTDPEDFRRLLTMVGDLFQGLPDHDLFDLAERRPERNVDLPGGPVGAYQFGRQVLGADGGRVHSDRHPLDDVPELSNIPRPAIAHQDV